MYSLFFKKHRNSCRRPTGRNVQAHSAVSWSCRQKRSLTHSFLGCRCLHASVSDKRQPVNQSRSQLTSYPAAGPTQGVRHTRPCRGAKVPVILKNPSLYPATFHNAGARGVNLRNPTPLGVWRVQEGNNKSKRVQEKCGFKYQWTTENVDVPRMHEKRTGHVSMITKEDCLHNMQTAQ